VAITVPRASMKSWFIRHSGTAMPESISKPKTTPATSSTP